MIESLDREAIRLAISRQSLIKLWIADCLTGKSSKKTELPDPTLEPAAPSAKQRNSRP
jgi:hypothetical protein